jgi:hypothetical protein
MPPVAAAPPIIGRPRRRSLLNPTAPRPPLAESLARHPLPLKLRLRRPRRHILFQQLLTVAIQALDTHTLYLMSR